MTVFFSQLINGLSLGSIYALIALGYSMVYGIILLLNFAHGDVIMVGAYMSWFVMNQLGLGPVTAVCATIITCTLLGVVIEKIAYTPLRSAPRISLLITAIGVSFFLEYTAELILGSGAKVIPAYYTNQTFHLGKVPLGLTSIITLVVTVLSMLVLTFLVQKTKLGKAMRAVSEDMDAARAQVGKTYYFAKADAKLPEGRYFIDDLIGCTVLHADDGRTLGIVAKVDHPGVQDIYIVRDAAGEEHWIPAVPEFVVDVDIAARTVKMRPIAGMFDEPVNGDEE